MTTCDRCGWLVFRVGDFWMCAEGMGGCGALWKSGVVRTKKRVPVAKPSGDAVFIPTVFVKDPGEAA